MRIAVVHSFYDTSQPSGETSIVQFQLKALADAGHNVEIFSRSTDELSRDKTYKLRAALGVASGIGATPLKQIDHFAPDVVHLHNTFPNFGTAWISQAATSYPLVQTLHNFRAFCASASLFRDGQHCKECVTTSPLAGLRHACYRSSRVATLPLTLSQTLGTGLARTFPMTKAIIALSERQADTLADLGVPRSKLDVVANPVDGVVHPDLFRPPSGFCFVGRLAAEKGILELVRNWPPGHHLDIYGDGPLRSASIDAAAGKDISFLGNEPRETLRRKLSSYTAIVIPSKWIEPAASLVYLEALACGTPAISLPENAVADSIKQHRTGIVLSSLTPMSILNGVKAVQSLRDEFSKNSIRTALTEYSVSKWIRSLERIYQRIAN